MNPPRWTELDQAYREACRVLAQPPGPAHLLGIGGVGMAALAVQLQARGHAVSGCDAQESRITRRLASLGIPVATGHDPAHLRGGEQLVVRSPAVRDDEPEWRAALRAGVPAFPRGVVLPVLLRDRSSVAVAGSHGKTTTTAMLAHILRATGRPVAYAIGGEIDEAGGVARADPAAPLVVEADESDGTLALYEAEIAVVTNVELDHVDYFGDEAALDACFRRFVERTRRVVWYGADDPGAVRAAASHPGARGFGFAEDAALRAVDVRPTGPGLTARLLADGRDVGVLALPVPGRTNLLDALGALGAAQELGVPWGEGVQALASFRAVKRRFEIVARAEDRVVISDYAHHPTEIRAVLEQVRGLRARRVIAVFQPHRYTRTAALGAAFPPAFEGVDELVLAPVYAASEDPVPGGTSADLAAHFASAGFARVTLSQSLLEAWDVIRNKWRAGDVLLVVGAGDVECIAAWAAKSLPGASHG